MPVRRMEIAKGGGRVDPVTAALVGWLVDRAATAGQRVLAQWLGGDKQAKALRLVVSEAIRAAAAEIDVPGGREAVAEALRREGPGTPEVDVGDVLTLTEAVLRLISPRLAVLAEQGYRVDIGGLADAITQRIENGIQINAARGGSLAPVAELLRHERLVGVSGRIAGAAERGADASEEMRRLLSSALSAPGSGQAPSRPVRLAPRPARLAGREELLAEVHRRLTGGRNREATGGGAVWAGRGGEDQRGS